AGQVGHHVPGARHRPGLAAQAGEHVPVEALQRLPQRVQVVSRAPPKLPPENVLVGEPGIHVGDGRPHRRHHRIGQGGGRQVVGKEARQRVHVDGQEPLHVQVQQRPVQVEEYGPQLHAAPPPGPAARSVPAARTVAPCAYGSSRTSSARTRPSSTYSQAKLRPRAWRRSLTEPGLSSSTPPRSSIRAWWLWPNTTTCTGSPAKALKARSGVVAASPRCPWVRPTRTPARSSPCRAGRAAAVSGPSTLPWTAWVGAKRSSARQTHRSVMSPACRIASACSAAS